MQFGRAFPRILKEIWGVDPSEGPAQVSKLGVMDAYQHVTPRKFQLEAFAYIVSSAPDNNAS